MLEVKKLFGVLLLGFAVYFLFPLLTGRQEWIVSGAVAAAVGLGLIVLDVRGLASVLSKAKLALGTILIAGGVYAAAVGGAGVAEEGGLQWHHSFEEASEVAARQGKPMMIDFFAEWCAACKEMDALTFSDEKVIEAAKGVIPVKIDLTAQTQQN